VTDQPAADRDSLPLLTIDLDGVICAPILGWNVGIHRTFLDPDAPPPTASRPPRWLGDPLDWLRFEVRRPLPEAREALFRLHRIRRVVVLTGRRSAPRGWLRRYGMSHYVDDVEINATDRASPHYKLEALARLHAAEHVDDDGRTAQLLAQRSEARIYLRDWPRNRGLEFHAGVTRVGSLLDVARRLEESA
jgi:hypothetical protein